MACDNCGQPSCLAWQPHTDEDIHLLSEQRRACDAAAIPYWKERTKVAEMRLARATSPGMHLYGEEAIQQVAHNAATAVTDSRAVLRVRAVCEGKIEALSFGPQDGWFQGVLAAYKEILGMLPKEATDGE